MQLHWFCVNNTPKVNSNYILKLFVSYIRPGRRQIVNPFYRENNYSFLSLYKWR